MTVRRGAFIVFEGCDRAGKSTQCQRLAKELTERGHRTEVIRFPDRTTTTGKLISQYLTGGNELDDHSVHLLFSSNRWDKRAYIQKTLQEGINVIADRYVYSGVAFSAAKGLDFHWCQRPDVGLIKPDLVVFLDLDINEALKRGGFGQERYETIEMQESVRKLFHRLQDDSWKVFDASKSLDEVAESIRQAVEPTISIDSLPDLGKIAW